MGPVYLEVACFLEAEAVSESKSKRGAFRGGDSDPASKSRTVDLIFLNPDEVSGKFSELKTKISSEDITIAASLKY